MSIGPGTRLGRYQIRSKLGTGGMGEVYLAHDTNLERMVALKILPADVTGTEERLRRFVQEARAASSLNHPNILTVFEIDATPPLPLIATEFVDGETLRDRVRAGSMTSGEALDTGIQVAAALEAAHAAGVIHRDIKPENIMRRRDGLVKLLDFGLAKINSDVTAASAVATRSQVVTRRGVVSGTVMYMSPEQARGVPVDARTDLFSLGVVLYELITNRLPFEGSSANEIIASLLSDRQPEPLARYASTVPDELQRIIAKALRKNPDERYQTAKDLLIDLKMLKQAVDFDRHASGSTGWASRQERGLSAAKTVRFRRVTALIAVLVGAAAAGYWLWRPPSPVGRIDSVAVLPFENRTQDKALDYLSDGVTESLINSLSLLRDVRVTARSSVFIYKGQAIDVREAARRLNVRAVLMGRVLMQGDTLDVRTELTDARNNVQLWENTMPAERPTSSPCRTKSPGRSAMLFAFVWAPEIRSRSARRAKRRRHLPRHIDCIYRAAIASIKAQRKISRPQSPTSIVQSHWSPRTRSPMPHARKPTSIRETSVCR